MPILDGNVTNRPLGRCTGDVGPAGTAWHGLVGRLTATVVTLLVDRAVVRSWLHSGLDLPEGDESRPHPLLIYFGQQESVSPELFGFPIRFPFCYRYPELITAVPDLEIAFEGVPRRAGPVTYLGRLFLNSWTSTILGRGLYSINKCYARIEACDGRFYAANRRGRRLLDARIVRRGPPGPLQEPVGRATWLLNQPLAFGSRGRLRLGKFEFERAGLEIAPVDVAFDMAPELLSWLPAMRREFRGIDEDPDGAFEFTATWRLTRAKVCDHAE